MNKEKMTEAEIIQAWKQNEYMAFGGMPVECQEWAKEHKNKPIWFGGREMWIPRQSIDCLSRTVYRLDPNYQPTPKPVVSDWVELDIHEESYTIPVDAGNKNKHWQDHKLHAARGFRTLLDGRILTKFGGWYWPHAEGGCWSSVPQIDTNEVPARIRFWAERIES